MKKLLLALGLCSILSSPAFAKHMPQGDIDCVDGMQQSVTINIGFIARTESLSTARKRSDEKLAQIADFVKQNKFGKFELISSNVNLNSQTTFDEETGLAPWFQQNSNVVYAMDSMENAYKLADYLTKEKYQVSINAKKQKSAACLVAEEDKGDKKPTAEKNK